METPEEFNDQIHMAMSSIKGRRTKRQRPVTSSTTCGGATLSSTSSSGGGDHEDFASSSSVSHTISTEEEEDMANCLILLAQGPSQITTSSTQTTKAGVGFFVYECKTCNRTFPSFQALGGHRASHKKPKLVPVSVPNPVPVAASIIVSKEESEELESKKMIPVQMINNKAAKIHECSICGLEFTSGQALGGHMRRHRAVASGSGSGSAMVIKQRNILELDLNLPAPEEDLRDSKFQFTPTPQTIVFSSPTLVDCHY